MRDSKYDPYLTSTIPSIEGPPCGLTIQSSEASDRLGVIAITTMVREQDGSIRHARVMISKASIEFVIVALKRHGEAIDQ